MRIELGLAISDKRSALTYRSAQSMKKLWYQKNKDVNTFYCDGAAGNGGVLKTFNINIRRI